MDVATHWSHFAGLQCIHIYISNNTNNKTCKNAILFTLSACDFKQNASELPVDTVPSFGDGSGFRLCSSEPMVPTTEHV